MGESLASRLIDSFARHEARPAAHLGKETITYRELGARALGVAEALWKHGIGPGHRVGLWMEKSFDSLAVLVGSVFSGAVYVPIDVRMPLERVRLIAADCDFSAMAVDGLRRPHLPDLEGALSSVKLLLGREGEARPAGELTIGELSGTGAVGGPPFGSEDPAYILYTSGSTGRPKGVVVSHRAALGFVDWCLRVFKPNPEDRMTSHAPWHFDLCTFDLFVTLCAGASVRLFTSTEAMLPGWIARNLSGWGITFWYSVPAALIAMVEQGGLNQQTWPGARIVLFAGEPYPVPKVADLRRALPQARLYNLFGPTETNVCTYYEVVQVDEEETRSLPIGKVCDHLEGLILDDERRPVEPGTEGDLWIGGANLFAGYWNDEGKANGRLRPDHRPGRSGFLYNTGDRVVLAPDGNLRFMGRRDHMVKVRGFRVEIGEVENALYAVPELAEAAVVALPREGTHALVAFVSWKTGSGSETELLERIGKRLPLYMIPERFVTLERLPRTANGKVDRLALAARAKETA